MAPYGHIALELPWAKPIIFKKLLGGHPFAIVETIKALLKFLNCHERSIFIRRQEAYLRTHLNNIIWRKFVNNNPDSYLSIVISEPPSDSFRYLGEFSMRTTNIVTLLKKYPPWFSPPRTNLRNLRTSKTSLGEVDFLERSFDFLERRFSVRRLIRGWIKTFLGMSKTIHKNVHVEEEIPQHRNNKFSKKITPLMLHP